MEPELTVSGNEFEPDTGNVIPENPEPSEPVVNNYTYETYETYQVDNSEISELLKELLSQAVKNNETVERLADSLDAVKEILTAEPEETSSDDSAPETTADENPEETETDGDSLLEMLEGMEETFAGLKETSESIYETVSGNTLYLEDLSNTAQAFTESYSESLEMQSYTSRYGIALCICIFAVVCSIAGLHVAKMVWGKMR